MSLYKDCFCFVLFMVKYNALVSSDVVNPSSSLPADKLQPVPAAPPVGFSFPALRLLSSFPEELEISDYCTELLHIFAQRYVAYVECLVPAARPVKMCQSCFSYNSSLEEIYKNVSSDKPDQMAPGNVSCRDSLLRSDRLMIVYQLYSNLQDLWNGANCEKCITKDFSSLTNDTMHFMATLNQTLSCFEKYQRTQKNDTELCKNCKSIYSGLNELYSQMEGNQTLCMDIEDEMNMTRILWSKTFGCSFPREETVPVIAVSGFMLFLPIIFYLSSFLHSEQKKRKLIHPRRVKSYGNLSAQVKMN
ncbi:osteopetrosis-associated transmembrane protein 1 [Pholidichthys leucotaenia]